MSNWLKVILAAVAFIGVTAFAISHSKAQERFVLTVTPAELATVGKALEGLPYKDVAPLMSKLQSQVLEQQKPGEPPKAEAPKGGK